MSAKLLLVEDNETLGYILKEYLELKGFEVNLAKDGKAGLSLFKKNVFDLCILDIMMPEMDGFSLAREIKRLEPQTPFIFLTAKTLKVDKLKGFDIGAEDYIIKPVDEEELIARIKVILRRNHGTIQQETDLYKIGRYHFDVTNQLLTLDQENRRLTEKETILLYLLCQNKGKLLSRQQVLKNLWQKSDYFTRRSMDVFISRLRKYLGEDPAIRIANVYGSGFILTDGN